MIDPVFAVLVGTRFIAFASAMIVLGAALFPFYALPSQSTGVLAEIMPGARRVIRIAAFVAAASTLAWVATLIVEITGGVPSLIDHDTLSDFFLETSFGRIWLLRLALALGLLAMALLAPADFSGRNRSNALVLILAACLLASQAWIGHPAALSGSNRVAVTAAYVLHVLGAGVWIGGLVPLSLILSETRGQTGDALATLEYLLRRFSFVAVLAVASIVIGGVVNATSRMSSLGDFVTSAWGWTLLVKIGLVLVMVGFGGLNRFVLMPRISRQPENALAKLSRNVVIEQAAGFIVLIAAALLGILIPP